MSDLLVIVPSRGRPAAAAELAKTFQETCTADTKLLIALDDNDPTLDEYVGSYDRFVAHNRSMVEALNRAARAHCSGFAVGFMGDDHRPRTKGWDAAYLEVLRDLGAGIVYGNDLLQGERLPTQVAMTSDIVRALGYMAPPELTHLFVDNYWIDLGRAAGCIRYLPDVVVEHMHPVAQKAEWDEGHLRVNDANMYHTDRIAYTRFKAERKLAQAVAAVRALRGAA